VDQFNYDALPVYQAVAWNVIIPAIISAMGLIKGNGGGTPGADAVMTPEMREILATQVKRLRQQEPLYGDVMAMARGMLPTRYRVGQHFSGANAPAGGPGAGYNPNPHPGDYPGTQPKPGPNDNGWTPPGN
jgi:hypothetical protein